MTRLAGRKALVTGASRGIGRAIAARFAAEGADVAITARRFESLESTTAEIEAQGRRAVPMEWDVREADRARERLETAREMLGGLDIVVNNAGVLRDPERTPVDEWDYVLDTNLRGVYFICRAAGEMLAEQGAGAIINIASDYGFRGAPTPYGISKWGVVGMTRGLGREFAPRGVRINAIAPGPVATEMIGFSPGDPMENESLPLRRLTRPDEIAGIAVFLACDESSAIVGESIVVNSSNS
ncbi:MAG: SDR family oxidoreductase [Armatimonadetes bacterium]|nr:SDR family oxidoreductase [Armatimonadota bacterium]